MKRAVMIFRILNMISCTILIFAAFVTITTPPAQSSGGRCYNDSKRASNV